jgi:hypothetical protein
VIFPYQPYEADPTPSDPSPVVYRPVIPIVAHVPSSNKTVLLRGLVDSGADETILPMRFLKELGLDDGPRQRFRFATATGRPFEVIYGEIQLVIHDPGGAPFFWPATVAFSDSIDRTVLGRAGFLERFVVTFDGPARMLTIEPGRQ